MSPVELAQSVTTTASGTIDRIIGSFSTDELNALLWILIAILAAVHTVKVVFRYTVRESSNRELYVVTVVVSIISAWAMWPESSPINFFVPGLVMGPIANAAFWGVSAPLKRFMPRVWSGVNLDRRRRRNTGLPRSVRLDRRQQDLPK